MFGCLEVVDCAGTDAVTAVSGTLKGTSARAPTAPAITDATKVSLRYSLAAAPGLARPLAWNLPPGSISTDSTTTAPAIGFGADGCDSTTVGLPGVMSATTGRSAG